MSAISRKDVAWWAGGIVLLLELTAVAAYPHEALEIARTVYLTCWKYAPLPEGVERPTYNAER